jgi:hypothetical protein
VFSNGAVDQIGDLCVDTTPCHINVLGHRHVCVAEMVGVDAGRQALVLDERGNVSQMPCFGWLDQTPSFENPAGALPLQGRIRPNRAAIADIPIASRFMRIAPLPARPRGTKLRLTTGRHY